VLADPSAHKPIRYSLFRPSRTRRKVS